MFGDAPVTDPSGASSAADRDGADSAGSIPIRCEDRALLSHIGSGRRLPGGSPGRDGRYARDSPSASSGAGEPHTVRVTRRQLRALKGQQEHVHGAPPPSVPAEAGGDVVTLSSADYNEVLGIVSRYRRVLAHQGQGAQVDAGGAEAALQEPASAVELHPLSGTESPRRGYEGHLAVQGTLPGTAAATVTDAWFDGSVQVGQSELVVSGGGGVLTVPFADVARFELLPAKDGIACVLRNGGTMWLRCAPEASASDQPLAAALAALLPSQPAPQPHRAPPAQAYPAPHPRDDPVTSVASSQQPVGAPAPPAFQLPPPPSEYELFPPAPVQSFTSSPLRDPQCINDSFDFAAAAASSRRDQRQHSGRTQTRPEDSARQDSPLQGRVELQQQHSMRVQPQPEQGRYDPELQYHQSMRQSPSHKEQREELRYQSYRQSSPRHRPELEMRQSVSAMPRPAAEPLQQHHSMRQMDRPRVDLHERVSARAEPQHHQRQELRQHHSLRASPWRRYRDDDLQASQSIRVQRRPSDGASDMQSFRVERRPSGHSEDAPQSSLRVRPQHGSRRSSAQQHDDEETDISAAAAAIDEAFMGGGSGGGPRVTLLRRPSRAGSGQHRYGEFDGNDRPEGQPAALEPVRDEEEEVEVPVPSVLLNDTQLLAVPASPASSRRRPAPPLPAPGPPPPAPPPPPQPPQQPAVDHGPLYEPPSVHSGVFASRVGSVPAPPPPAPLPPGLASASFGPCVASCAAPPPAGLASASFGPRVASSAAPPPAYGPGSPHSFGPASHRPAPSFAAGFGSVRTPGRRPSPLRCATPPARVSSGHSWSPQSPAAAAAAAGDTAVFRRGPWASSLEAHSARQVCTLQRDSPSHRAIVTESVRYSPSRTARQPVRGPAKGQPQQTRSRTHHNPPPGSRRTRSASPRRRPRQQQPVQPPASLSSRSLRSPALQPAASRRQPYSSRRD